MSDTLPPLRPRDERQLVVTYTPGSATFRVARPSIDKAAADAAALRRAADLVTELAARR